MKNMLAALLALSALGACERQSGVMEEIARAEKEETDRAANAAAQSGKFLDDARARVGVVTTASGLAYEVTRAAPDANLPRPPREGQVLVHYEGRLADGTVFDSSIERGQPAEFPVAGVVPGFAEALMVMRPGEEIIAYLPSELAYGEEGSPPRIPPNAALQFRIQLLAFARPDGQIFSAPGLERRQ